MGSHFFYHLYLFGGFMPWSYKTLYFFSTLPEILPSVVVKV
jgi:hypothetical protein